METSRADQITSDPWAPPTVRPAPWFRTGGRAGWLAVARTALIIFAVAAVYFGPRLIGIDRLLGTDEADWLGGAGDFYSGLVHGHPEQTYQLPHPGVPVLWAGVIAYLIQVPDYPAIHPQPLSNIHVVHSVFHQYGIDPMTMLITARIVKLLFETVLFLLAGWLLVRLFDRWLAAVTLALVAFEPFIVGNDRFLHIDGMVTSASFAAVLAIAYAARWRDQSWFWVMAGALSAIAWLTRFTAGVLGVVAVVVIVAPPLLAVLRRRQSFRAGIRHIMMPLVAYLGSSVVATFGLWPALLTHPRYVLTRMWDYTKVAVNIGHELPMFYNGRIVHGDPGWWFYPDLLLWRISAVTLIGVAVLIVGALVQPWVVLPTPYRMPLLVAVGFAAGYGVLMDDGAKKFDRYILPVFPVLDLLAAVGFVGLARLILTSPLRLNLRRWLAAGLGGVVVLAQIGSALSDLPYGWDYYNPLRGGIAAAQHHVQLGWGEGMDQAAAWIEAQPGGDHATVLTQNNQVTLMYLAPPSMTVLNSGIRNDPLGLSAWATTDYYVSYLSQWERDLSPVMQDQAARYPPVHTITIDGVVFANIYDIHAIPPPVAMVASLLCRADFGDVATLLTYRDSSTPRPGDDHNRRTLSLYFQTGQTPPAGDLAVHVRLEPRDAGLTPIDADATLHLPATTGLLGTAQVDLPLPHGRTTGSYDVRVTVEDAATGQVLNAQPMTGSGSDTGGSYAVANGCDHAGVVNGKVT